MKRGLIGGAVLAVLWFLCVWIPYGLSLAGGSLATLAQLIPSPMGRGVLGSPLGWAVVVQVLTVAALVAGFAALAAAFGRRGGSFAAGWLAAVLTTFAIGAFIDVGSFVTWVGSFGIRGAAGTMGAAAMTTWWGVLVGWVPALVSTRSVSHQRPDAALPSRGADAPPADAPLEQVVRTSPPRARTFVAAVAALALIALPFAVEAGHAATQQQLREDQAAETPADPDGAAAPDPSAEGEPVPTAAASDGAVPDDACTAANTTILAPAPDGATGHRGHALSLVNVSDEPCVVEGYPDVAYGDQNDHLLDVTVERGGSFMAADPGPAPLTLQPGDAASAVIGWDANSVHGQLAARSVWIAVRPGEERLSWAMPLDIIGGATVSATAWHVPTPAG